MIKNHKNRLIYMELMTVLINVNNGIKIVLMSIKGQKYIAHSMNPIIYNMGRKTGLIRCKAAIFGISPRSRLILSPPGLY